MDDLDQTLLDALSADARTPVSTLARRLGQRAQARDEAVLRYRDLPRLVAAVGPRHPRRAQHYQARAPAGLALVEVDDALAAGTVLLREVDAHGHHHHAVLEHHLADITGFDQLTEVLFHGVRSHWSRQTR